MGDTSHHADDTLHRRGLMFILSSPSGAGKTTLSKMLLAADSEIRLSVSATTRPPRAGEIDGVHYHFVTPEHFDRMIEEDDFYEWAEVFGHRYGTPKGAIRTALKDGRDFLFDIDWQGTQQLYQKDQQDVVRVFILPPSIDELHRRLAGRATDSAEVIAARMERARAEISHWDGYDYVIINDDVRECFAKVHAILEAERMKRARQTGLIPFVRGLMG
ncbi:guanylate kinase [Erythrobacter sp.]|uniref:guanylate kinase n=1 Tax=Erythrobacter sp. TaxID=1042 RepID=UPI0025FD04E6|nr:guanylate kinase [Erythrobacter sp.]